MTPVQWLFHYLEISKFNDEKVESDIEVLKSLIELFDSKVKFLSETIIDAAKISGAMANPESGRNLLEAEKLNEARADIGDEEFSEWWQDFSARIPNQLKVEDAGDNVDLEGDAINLEKLYELEMEARMQNYKKEQDN